jgi:mannan endo-1,4-beta-mannosidase
MPITGISALAALLLAAAAPARAAWPPDSRTAASAPAANAPEALEKAAAKVDPAPADPQVTAEARALYSRLLENYGKKIIAGQTHGHFDEVAALAGRRPMLRAFDMQNYSPRNPWHSDWSAWDDGTVQAAIDWHKSTGGKGIVTFQWHWFSPSGGKLRRSTFYTKETSFDVERGVTPGTREHAELLRDLDAIAAQLKRLADAGVPVLWRPLHEAGGRWFWWGAKGPAPAKKLYGLMFERFTRHHGLHNLLWVWSTPEAAWYPGNALVDVFGYDSYPGPHKHTAQAGIFADMNAVAKGRKMLALTEVGPYPDINKCFSQGAPWAYFAGWSELTAQQNSGAVIRAAFAHPQVLKLD